jgi:DNA-binding CsgD family transcriptional regulator
MHTPRLPIYVPKPTHLTPRETEILTLVKAGHYNSSIAEQLGCSVKTVKYHLTHIYEKLGTDRYAIMAGER